MINGIIISNPTRTDIKSAYQVFETTIVDAFEKEGLGSLKEDIQREVEYKKYLIDASLNMEGPDVYFKIAKLENTVIGTISFGPCGEEIRKCADGELNEVGEMGSLFILPSYQSHGIGSALIHAMAGHLNKEGIYKFCLDSGYKRAQKRWLRKFGEPYKVVKDYWGKGSDHMIWLCKVEDFI